MAHIAPFPPEINVDVAIAGGGIAGGTLACLLAGAGMRVASIDKLPVDARLRPGFDGRTTAISFGSRRVLEAAGIWNELETHACPIRDIRIADGASPGFLHFASEAVERRPFGWIVDNAVIRRALAARQDALGVVPLSPATVSGWQPGPGRGSLALEGGEVVCAPLVVGADGRGSTLRGLAGIGTTAREYDQTALVFTVIHQAAHDNVALEHFHPAGPFAVLPMVDDETGAHRSSVVWTVRRDEAGALLGCEEAEFDRLLAPLFDDYYGAVSLRGTRSAYPLGLQEADRYAGPRLALVSDAAHGIHPIAGQGLNLGLRDVALLAELVLDRARLGLDIGDPATLRHYERARRADAAQLIAATDGLNRLFSTELPPVRMLRTTGLAAVQHMPALKRFFMLTAMGIAGAPPRLVRGDRL